MLLRHDTWLDQPLKDKFPELHSYALDESLSVRDWTLQQDTCQLFYMPMSTQAYDRFQLLENLIQNQVQPQGKDQWVSKGQKGKFSSITMYHNLHPQQEKLTIFKWLW